MAAFHLVPKAISGLFLTLFISTSVACGSGSGAAAESSGKSRTSKGTACNLSIKVDGDVSFEASDVSYSINVGNKNEQPWIAVMGNKIVGSDHPFTFWLGIPQVAGVGDVPFYEEGQGKISLTLIDGGDYSPFQTADQGGEPGMLSIERLDPEWVEARGKAMLSDLDGGSVTVEVELAAAVPPAKCPK